MSCDSVQAAVQSAVKHENLALITGAWLSLYYLAGGIGSAIVSLAVLCQDYSLIPIYLFREELSGVLNYPAAFSQLPVVIKLLLLLSTPTLLHGSRRMASTTRSEKGWLSPTVTRRRTSSSLLLACRRLLSSLVCVWRTSNVCPSCLAPS